MFYNLVTKRAYAYEGATVEWIDGNIGSKLTMKYPGIYLMGRKAYGETLSIAFAGKNQHQDTGAKMVHLAPDTTSKNNIKICKPCKWSLYIQRIIASKKGCNQCQSYC